MNNDRYDYKRYDNNRSKVFVKETAEVVRDFADLGDAKELSESLNVAYHFGIKSENKRLKRLLEDDSNE